MVEQVTTTRRCRPDSQPESPPRSSPESRPESRPEWWRRDPRWQPEWTAESNQDKLLRLLQDRPLGRAKIARALGHEGISGSVKGALEDMMERGVVEFTLPEKRGSRLLRHRMVEGDQR